MLPNFLVVGAAKCGTTSIYNYLKQHPEVFLPDHKDCFFLSGSKGLKKDDNKNAPPWVIQSFQVYADSFKGNEKAKAVGDVCVSYLYYHEETIRNIGKYLNQPKIIIILRNPVERAYSNFMMYKKFGEEKRGFRQALAEDETEPSKLYKKQGLYTEQVQAYLDNFKDVKIYLYEDLMNDSVAMMQDMFAFLGVDSSFRPDTAIRHNISGMPRVKLLNTFFLNQHLQKYVSAVTSAIRLKTPIKKMTTFINGKNLEKTFMAEADRQYLVNFYQKDVESLQNLIQRDLTHWLS